jgi:hypothetical protein
MNSCSGARCFESSLQRCQLLLWRCCAATRACVSARNSHAVTQFITMPSAVFCIPSATHIVVCMHLSERPCIEQICFAYGNGNCNHLRSVRFLIKITRPDPYRVSRRCSQCAAPRARAYSIAAALERACFEAGLCCIAARNSCSRPSRRPQSRRYPTSVRDSAVYNPHNEVSSVIDRLCCKRGERQRNHLFRASNSMQSTSRCNSFKFVRPKVDRRRRQRPLAGRFKQ